MERISRFRALLFLALFAFVLVLASVMASHQNRPSNLFSVGHMGFHLAIVTGANWVISGDLGVSTIFVASFVIMAFAGGVHLGWFGLAGGAVAAIAPYAWNNILTQRQKNRFLVLFNPNIDPLGLDERYQAFRSQLSLNGGGLLGQGLLNGNRTQTGALPSQHTDFIFSAIGEEMGYAGCVLVLVMLFAVVARCVWVGCRSQDYKRRLVCFVKRKKGEC